MFKKVLKYVKDLRKSASELHKYRASYMIEEIYDQDDEKWVVVRIIGTASTFKMLPNDILADDELTMTFSPLDIRTLTYLGYHNMNDARYRIVSEKTSLGGEKLYFVKEKGKKAIKPLKHNDMMKDEIRNNLNNADAFKLGNENNNQETIEINSIIGKIEQNKN